jgi:hypothetical protein
LDRSSTSVEPDVRPTLAIGQLPTFGTRPPQAKR